MAELKGSIENKLESLRHAIQTRPSEYLESAKEELLELKTKYAVNLEKRNNLSTIKDFFQRDMLRSNPLTSVKFKEALEELKQKASARKEK